MDANASDGFAPPQLLSILRIVAAVLFLEHGAQKLLGFPAAPPNGFPAFLSLIWWQGIIELVGEKFCSSLVSLLAHVAFVLGWRHGVCLLDGTRAPKVSVPRAVAVTPAIVSCFPVFLYVAFAGGGAWSIDRMLRKA